MPYTITCRYHESDHTVRHPREWEDFGEAARQLATFTEEMARSLSPPFGEAEESSVQALLTEAARAGVAVLPGKVSYRVVEVTDVPPLHRPAASDPPDSVDWPAVGRLARRLQQRAIELNHTASVAPAHDPGFDADGRARAVLGELVEVYVALNTHLQARPST